MARAIRSVLSQSYADWELIVVDDASDDNTPEVVRGHSDPRLRYVRHSRNKGAAAGRNTGIRLTQGRYIAFLDDDDEWMPTKLEAQVAVLDSSDASIGVTYCSAVFADDETGMRRIKRAKVGGWISKEMMALNPVGSPSRVMVRRECLRTCGEFDNNLPSCDDWDMWLRLAGKYQFVCTDQPLTIYHESTASLSANADCMEAGYAAIWEKHGLQSRSKGVRGTLHLRLGHRLCCYGALRRGRHQLLKAVLTNPLSLTPALCFLLSLLGSSVYRRAMFTAMAIAK